MPELAGSKVKVWVASAPFVSLLAAPAVLVPINGLDIDILRTVTFAAPTFCKPKIPKFIVSKAAVKARAARSKLVRFSEIA